jgi:hypothetical protein
MWSFIEKLILSHSRHNLRQIKPNRFSWISTTLRKVEFEPIYGICFFGGQEQPEVDRRDDKCRRWCGRSHLFVFEIG